MALLVKAGGGENVKPEVTEYETLLETAIANLTGKAFKPTQSKTVDPVPEGMEVVPDAGYTLEKVILNAFEAGVSGIDYGEVTISTSTNTVTIQHNLKSKPTVAYLICQDAIGPDVTGIWFFRAQSKYTWQDYMYGSGRQVSTNGSMNENQVIFKASSSGHYFNREKFYWIVIE